MALTQLSAQEVVDRAVTQRWGIPEFQRSFVWTPQKVRDLADSLWADYPIGTLLLWKSEVPTWATVAHRAKTPEVWVVDGQQRTTALCLIFGRKPSWWPDGDDWSEACDRFDVRFNPLHYQVPFFILANAVIRHDPRSDWLSVRDLLNADDAQLSELASAVMTRNDLSPDHFPQIWIRLDRVCKIRERMLIAIEEEKELEDMVEIYTRLNQAGTKATEADVFLALAASKNPGWVRDRFLPFAQDLAEGGFELRPNLLFRSWMAIGTGTAQLRQVKTLRYLMRGVWDQTEEAWRRTVRGLWQFGVLSADILPIKNALIPIAVMAQRFGDDFKASLALCWLLHATNAARYSGSPTAALAEDIGVITAGGDFQSVIQALRASLEPLELLTSDQALSDYRDRFLRLVLYLLAFYKGARDWGPGHHRLGFEGGEPLAGSVPDWHHIFPRAYLREHDVPVRDIDALANIAMILPETSLRISKRRPMSYLVKWTPSSGQR